MSSYRAAFLAGNTLEMLEHHQVWMDGQYSSLIRGSCGRRVAPLTVAAELTALSQHIKAHAPGRYERLHDEMRRRGHSKERIDLAWLRVLMPLVQAAGSGFVERSWTQMDDRELRTCVDAGIRIERTLLSRPPDLNRAQELSETPLRDSSIYRARERAVKRGRDHVVREKRDVRRQAVQRRQGEHNVSPLGLLVEQALSDSRNVAAARK